VAVKSGFALSPRTVEVAKIGALVVVAFAAALGTHSLLARTRRTRLQSEARTDLHRLRKMSEDLRRTPGIDEAERRARLARMNVLLGRLRERSAEISAPSEASLLAALVAGLVVAFAGFVLLARGARVRSRAALLMDCRSARPLRLADAGSFRLEGNRLVLARPPREDNLDDARDLRVALAKLLDRPEGELEVDATLVTSVSSQTLGAFAEAALGAREKTKKLSILASKEFAGLARVAGLDKLADVSVRR
jgi:hypothetical protein